jgi:acetate kinase
VGLQHAFEFLRERVSRTISEEVKAVGHRIVHGGKFRESVVMDKDAREEVKRAAIFAPLHNPSNLMGVEACSNFFRGRTQVCSIYPLSRSPQYISRNIPFNFKNIRMWDL